ncbi:sensor histidine kinase [Leeuwenhoekiella marinoflava]|uniref:histidine kinase n=2 Tax=Leeuwenhoekiella marinoflava TaxID=988 RepID=A0A4Q0PM47_9FLAO|nr:HAMP domain-containing sensor histidine kinase [Leeuwenhoekiella marinoflava]RXG29214.1 phospho-acceptor domain-containing protein [Leeuwenhoekiella marinoflava]SHF35276.1 His Kinase A (phospho-acceptor) domain-containing protein [Leeuwenhoekiella marinoflava DSM 3653]
MNATEEALKERIKELTCLYEVSSILVNADPEYQEETFQAIAFSLKKAFQFPEYTGILIRKGKTQIKTGFSDNKASISSPIYLFNKEEGAIVVSLKKKEMSFLREEQQLIDNIALKIGDFLERVAIKKNESLLKRQMEHADRLSILGELTAGIAHELNTPLANILGFAELLKESMASDKTAASDLDKIIKNTIFSREVVKKLMFFACAMPKEKKHINIVPHIYDSLDLLEATFRKEQVSYQVKIEEEALVIQADTVQITQIIFNLIINAIYFSPKNGVVTIEAFQDTEHIILKILDEGPGLSEEALEKVFQPFFTTKPTGEGSGLGLSVVHGIVASHKGSIVAQNNTDKGAIFSVRLPK